MPVRYILLSVWVRLSIFSKLYNMWAVCFVFTHFLSNDWENIYILCLIIIIKSEEWTLTHCLGLGHERMACAVCLSLFLWICDMAGLLRRTFVSWWYLPWIWPPVTDMHHYWYARYPTDDWHLAYMFSLVYFSVKVCLEGVFPRSVSTRRDPCLRVNAPLMLPLPPPPPPPTPPPPPPTHPPHHHHHPPPTRKENQTGVTRLSTCTKRGGIWTDAWVCLHHWVIIWVAW